MLLRHTVCSAVESTSASLSPLYGEDEEEEEEEGEGEGEEEGDDVRGCLRGYLLWYRLNEAAILDPVAAGGALRGGYEERTSYGWL